ALTVRAPHPEMPWAWGESAIEYQRWWTADDVAQDFMAEVLPDEHERVSNAIGPFLAYKIEEQYLEPFDLAHDDVEEYLLHHFPESEAAPDDELPLIPDR